MNVAACGLAVPTRLVMRMSVTASVASGSGDACGVMTLISVASALTLTMVAGSVAPTGAPMTNSTVSGWWKFLPVSVTGSPPRGEPRLGMTL